MRRALGQYEILLALALFLVPVAGRAGEGHLMVRLRTRAAEAPNWHKSVDIYVRLGARPSVVGIEREID